MRHFARVFLLALALCGCVARADGTVTAASTWYIHGIARTAQGGIVAGGAVELWRGDTLVARRDMPSQAFGITVSQTAGVYQVRYTPPDGWRCVDVRSAGVGWQYPGGCVGQIALPEQAPSLGPDLVFVVTGVQEVTETATPYTPTPTPIFSKTPEPEKATPTVSVTCTSTPWPTLPMPPATPPIPTPEPLPTPPDEGWELWEQPDATLANALAWEVQWLLGEYAQPDDPLWLAASSAGPCWAIAAPMITHYDVAAPDGSNVEVMIRWQPYLTPRGWRVVFATVGSPYDVAIAEGEGW